jgi:hypothetical protein
VAQVPSAALRAVRYQVRIQREGFPIYRAEVDAENESEAVDKVFERETTPAWALESDWQDVTVDEVTDESA